VTVDATRAVELTIRGGSVVHPDGSVATADLDVDAGRIVALRDPHEPPPPSARTLDVSGRIVGPGLIDIQINGGWGVDFTTDPTAIDHVAERLPQTGVTSFVPTIVTGPPERRAAARAAFAGRTSRATGAQVLGLHFEGPLISPARPGAHDARWIGLPAADELATWTRANGVVLVTLAPEVAGAIDVVRQLTGDGVIVSIGHTACSAAEFAAARRAGASLVTHLFNAMAKFDHRDPGPIGATLADPHVRAGLICDGVHCDPIAIEMAWRALGPERTVLVSDAVAALGSDAGAAVLASRAVRIDDVSVRTEDGVLAGSKLSLDRAVRNLVAMTGCGIGEAIVAASGTPAAALGLTDRGRIAPGTRADLVVLSDDLTVEHTLIGGRTAWRS
jgi:N-acetylglucosamine-6-phosphate deacetylase